jgi:4-alpha-glucanotransferase
MGILQNRSCGTLLHISVLPSQYGIGDLGPSATRFADILEEAGHRHWQVLPLNPTSIECGNSPYSSESGYAGNPLFISPEKLASEGLLEGSLTQYAIPESSTIDYATVEKSKKALLKKAYSNFRKREMDFEDDFDAFEDEHGGWLDDYALYKTFWDAQGQPWYKWPEHLKMRERGALKAYQGSESVRFHKFCQFCFFKQWAELKKHCQEKGIGLIGDLPYYLSHDSADVWANPRSFKLNLDRYPTAVSGVPPDYFSANGQLWGHPVYDWEQIQEDDYALWVDRIGHSLKLFEALRIDHFRGLVAYWEVPMGETTAVWGSWVPTPPEFLSGVLPRSFPLLPFIAEDLGVITEDVRQAIRRLGLPGMRVLIFGFDGDPRNPHLPGNHSEDSVAYTGTHDTNTARGWFVNEANEAVRQRLFNCIGSTLPESEISWAMMRLVSGSRARLSIFPIQDILSLGPESRLNRPSVAKDNYLWKLTESQFNHMPASKLRELVAESNRL